MTALQCLSVIVGAFLSVSCHAAVVDRIMRAHRKAAPPHEQQASVVMPLEFQQDLVVCNAYEGNNSITIKQNGKDIPGDNQTIPFKACRPIRSHVRAKDKFDFVLGKASGIQGSFEIGALPDTDTLLLLVVERRDARSPLMAFQSFAFPLQTDGEDAHLAVIDAYKGNTSMPYLRMEDHVVEKESKMLSKRIEQLNFGRIYAIQQGHYDASIVDHVSEVHDKGQQDGGQLVTRGSKQALDVKKRQNYVALRVGDGPSQALALYPEFKSGTRSISRLCLAGFLLLTIACSLQDTIESYPMLGFFVAVL